MAAYEVTLKISSRQTMFRVQARKPRAESLPPREAMAGRAYPLTVGQSGWWRLFVYGIKSVPEVCRNRPLTQFARS